MMLAEHLSAELKNCINQQTLFYRERKQQKVYLRPSALCSGLITYNYKIARCEKLIENIGCLRLKV